MLQWPEITAALGALLVSMIVAATAWFKAYKPGPPQSPAEKREHGLGPAMNKVHDDLECLVEQVKRLADIGEKIVFFEGLKVRGDKDRST